MKLFQVSFLVFLLHVLVTESSARAGIFDLCDRKDDIQASTGVIYFNSSSVGVEGKPITCEKIIYSLSPEQDRLKLTMTTNTSLHANNDMLEVFDGPSGKEKISPVNSNGQHIYETTGNVMKIVLKLQKSTSSSRFYLEGKFVAMPFQATCRCAGVQNGFSKCFEVGSQMNCSFQCKQGFVDLFNSMGSHTCNLRDGKWSHKDSGKYGCVHFVLVPEIEATVNFTLSKSVCHFINASKIKKAFFDHLFFPQIKKFQNGMCAKSNYSHCLKFNCVEKDDKAEMSVTIKDKAVNTSDRQSTMNSKNLIQAYIINDTDITKVVSVLIKDLNDSRITVSDIKSQIAADCPNGTVLVDLLNKQEHACTKCPRGTLYKSQTNTCEICPGGNSSLVKCPSETGSGNVPPEGTCEIKCLPGKRLMSGFCQWCPYNTYQNSSVCSNCPDTKKTLYPGSTSFADCLDACQKGQFFDKKSISCVACPLGTYSNDIYHMKTWCEKCKAGMVTHANGSKLQSDCLPLCSKGQYFDQKKQNCSECKIGWYQNKENQLVCLQCPNGTLTQTEGSTDISSCMKTCPKGTYLSAHDRSCIKCPLGTYMESGGHAQIECKKCESNKTTYVEGASSGLECRDTCSVGKYFNSGSSVCTKCNIGNYQNKINQLSCIQCPKNTSTQSQGSSALSDCIKVCPKGTYINMQTRTCVKCPFGTYSDKDQHLLSACTNCPAGKTTYIMGVSDKTKCFNICKVGHFFKSSLSSCQVCPRGTFRGETQKQNCTTCPTGLYTKNKGATSILECIKFVCSQGEYLDPQNGDCHQCGKGTYQSEFNHTKTTCQSCQSGRTKGEGSNAESACIVSCDSSPCENGGSCSETIDGVNCTCPAGVSGERCDVLDEKEQLQTIQVSLRITSLTWNKDLADPSTAAFKKVSSMIETSLTDFSEEIVAAKVRRLSSGSVIADVDLYTNNNASLVPAKTLQAAAAQGKIGNLSVDPGYFSITQVTCSLALGMENGRIKDEQITASSSKDEEGKGRLNGKAWHALKSQAGQYLQIRFHSNVNITAIATQGDSSESFVETYHISYSNDGDAWTSSVHSNNKKKVYHVNTSSIVKEDLQPPITLVKFIRVTPLTWKKNITLRIELYGCLSDPVLQKEAPTNTPQPPHTEKGNPDVKGSKDQEEDEYAWGKYLGIAFGLIMLAVIVIASVMWWRSSKKKKQREDTPLVLTRIQDTNNRDMDANDEDEDAV